MATITSFFGGAFFGGEFFNGSPTPTVKKGSNWNKRRIQDDELVMMAVIQSYSHMYNSMACKRRIQQ